MEKRHRILVCDDEAAARRGAVRALGRTRFEFEECENGHQCLQILDRFKPDLVLLDLRMPVLDGRATLARIVALPDPPPVVMLTADSAIDTAIAAVLAGAEDFVTKPYEIEVLRLVIDKVLTMARLQRKNLRLEQELRCLRKNPGNGPFIGDSPVMKEVFAAIARLAPTSASVLITGETGTGKELAARRIHQLSPVAEGPFVAVNCAAIPATLVESELFGYRRGAFTGAERDQRGKIREADGGTLLLDEIGDMPLAVQAKLLRVLSDGVVEPLGGGGQAVRVRVLAATHRDLGEMVADGHFRQDLLFRLRVVELAMPPLADRGADVVLLARHFIEEFAQRPLRLTSQAEAALPAYHWPGNVRELRNAIERALIFCRGGIVQLADLPAEVALAATASAAMPEHQPLWRPGEDFQTAKARMIERFEREIITQALTQHGGNISAAAQGLGLHRQNLQRKLRQLAIPVDRPRR